jgi:Na+/melibiose symporter-like transporter
MMYAIFPDIPDVDELKTGERREGIYAALVTFIRKLSSALAIFAVSNAIAIAGYVQPVETVSGGVTRLVEQPQSPGFILVLRLVFAIVPVVLLAGALFFAARYPLTSEVHQRLNAVLADRRQHGDGGERHKREAEELERLLIGE